MIVNCDCVEAILAMFLGPSPSSFLSAADNETRIIIL